MNIDGVGQIGATVYGSTNTASMDSLARSVLREVAGTEASQDRPGRNSDQGFYGIGLPLLQFNHDRTDPGGRYWFWHTEEDTFDKIDFDILAGDARLYVSALTRLLTSPIPPVRLQAATSELQGRLEERQKWAGSRFDLTKAIEKAAALDALARELDARLASYEPEGQRAGEIARHMVRVIRPVLRVTYQEHGPYHQDPALEVPTLPGFAALETLAALPADSDRLGFTMTHLVRERNRLEDHLEQALTEARDLERRLEGSTSN
jgi:aminopeptidase YwaD